MYEKDEIKLEAISGIDEEIIDKTTALRWQWITNMKKEIKKSRLWIRIASLAACFCLILGGSFGLWHLLGKKVPIYTGMSVQNQAPSASISHSAMQDTASTLAASPVNVPLQYSAPMTYAKKTQSLRIPFFHAAKEDTFELESNLEDLLASSVESAKSEYFAHKNEDVYFVIHVDNPYNFEILSFTLNGIKYSNYMFEQGSDMETLILKYNVGDVEGVQEYTIDAIKYVDGERIKDVRMKGERTVRVHIIPENLISEERIGFDRLSFVVNFDDSKGANEESESRLYAILYDGDTVVEQKAIQSGESVSFEGLLHVKSYQYAVVAVYDIPKTEDEQAYVLVKKDFQTQGAVVMELGKLEGVSVSLSTTWSEDYTGPKELISFGLYEGDTLIRTLSEKDTSIDRLPFDKNLHVKAIYNAGGNPITVSYPIESPQSTEGLMVVDNVVVGYGLCNTTVLYINRSIADRAFLENKNITAVYLGENCATVGSDAFWGCPYLRELYLAEGVRNVKDGAFGALPIEEVTIPSTLGSNNGRAAIGYYAFGGGALKRVVISEGVTDFSYTEAVFIANGSLTEVVLPSNMKGIGTAMFAFCAIQKIYLPASITTIEDSAFDSTVWFYCEAPSKPEGWKDNWNQGGTRVVWNYKG